MDWSEITLYAAKVSPGHIRPKLINGRKQSRDFLVRDCDPASVAGIFCRVN